MRLKVTLKLLIIFGIEARDCSFFDNFWFKCKENKQKFAKSMEVAINFQLAAQNFAEQHLSLGRKKALLIIKSVYHFWFSGIPMLILCPPENKYKEKVFALFLSKEKKYSPSFHQRRESIRPLFIKGEKVVALYSNSLRFTKLKPQWMA